MKRHLFTGLFILLPFVITYIILAFLISIITDPFDRFINIILEYFHLFRDGIWIFSRKETMYVLSKICVLIALTFFIFGVGIISHVLTVHALHDFAKRLLSKIPFINKVYVACKQCIDLLFTPKVEKEGCAALVPYPTETEKSLGFVMQEVSLELFPDKKEDYVIVFIPCTPNATSGYLCTFAKKNVIFTNIPGEQAMKFVLSCGTLGLHKIGNTV